MNCRKFISLAVTTLLFSMFMGGAAEARIYKKVVNGREVVVHTSMIPVLLHRAVPPQYGRHVTERELQTGHIPQPRR